MRLFFGGWRELFRIGVFAGLKKFLYTCKMKNVISIIMGGGRGTRLYPLTKYRCKPAVPLAGKYRLVDIPISNCINSGCDRIDLLSQFNTASLHKHIQQTYKFDSFGKGFVDILAAEQTDSGGSWYQGTADAVRKNMHHFERHGDNCYYLILSGDHIYKMDYADMIAYHDAKEAAATIAVIPVPMEEASRFGIMNTDEEGNIVEFEEKPAVPKSTLASMGIYVFTAQKLYKYLEEDCSDPKSSNDFGKDILPKMLKAGEKMMAYEFNGYWKDVGTIDSLYEANMDLLGDNPKFNVADSNWKIQSRSPLAPPHYIGEHSKVGNSIIMSGCEIDGAIENSVLASNVMVKSGAVIKNSIIMADCVIEEGAVVEYSIIDGANGGEKQ